MPRRGECSGCCTRQMGCTSCARCLPRYLCVDVTVTPGPYTDIDCCDPDAYGAGHFSFRLTQSCGAWSGSGTCTGLAESLDLSVALNAECTQTIVDSTLMSEPAYFTGVLPSVMTGTAETSAGDILDWEISRANVVENPLALDICSPCSCATCLPERLCVTVVAAGDAYNPEINEAISYLWDCTTRSWVADGAVPDGFSITIAMKAASDGICGIDVEAGGNYGTYTGVITLEGALHPRKFHGTICEDSDGLTATLGVPELRPCDPPTPCEDPPPQEYVSYIDETIALMDGETQTGTVTIRDQSCGECAVPNCGSVTPPGVPTVCCPGVDIPNVLYGTDDLGNEVIFTYSPSPGTWIGSGQFVGCLSNTWTLSCEVFGEFQQWYFGTSQADFLATEGVNMTVVCEPFEANIASTSLCDGLGHSVTITA